MPVRMNALHLFRQIHLYLGVFTAPAILFFAFTGALQTFNLHSTSRDGSYQAPHWIVVLAQLHKKQTTVLPVRKPQAVAAASDPGKHSKKEEKDAAAPATPTEGAAKPQPVPMEGAPKPQTAPNPLPMRIFFLLVSVSLFASTWTGIYMSWKFKRQRIVLGVLLLAGIVIPLVLTRL